MKSAISGITKAYIYALFIAAACYYDNGYFNIIDAKAYICTLLPALVVPLLVQISFVAVIAGKKEKARVRIKAAGSFRITDAALAAFSVAAILSCISGDSARDALLGNGGWGCGALLILLLFIMYLYISRVTNIADEKNILPVIFGGLITFGWAILNFFGVDIGGMHEGFYDAQTKSFYLCGIGNVNNISEYLCMIIPFAVVAFAGCKIKKIRIMLGVYLLLGGFCTVIIDADSVYLGMGAAGASMILYALGTPERIQRISLPLAIVFSGAALVAIPLKLLSDTANSVDGLSAVFLCKYVFAGAAVLCIAVFFLIKICKNHFSRHFVIISRATIIMLFAVAGTAGALYLFRDFGDNWGSHRGFIWIRAWSMFSELPITKKLFGVGCDCFGTAFHVAYNTEILQSFGMTVSNVHCELLQYLLTTGVFGLLAYISIYVCSLVGFLKNKERPMLSAAAFFGIVGYAGQALVNNPHAFNCSVLFFLLALFAAGNEPGSYNSTSLPLSADS